MRNINRPLIGEKIINKIIMGEKRKSCEIDNFLAKKGNDAERWEWEIKKMKWSQIGRKGWRMRLWIKTVENWCKVRGGQC